MTKSGFTLIELSIVLVIIGLLAGGILVGRALIESAEMRSQMRTIDEIKTGLNLFKLKYGCLPGDCARATDFGFYALKQNNTSFLRVQENGNGDGFIREYWDLNNNSNTTEVTSFLPHLSQSGVLRVAIDESKYPSIPMKLIGAYQVYDYVEDLAFWPKAKLTNGYGYINTNASNTNTNSEIIYLLDSKYDDGKGFEGQIKIFPDELDMNSLTSCVDNSGTYRISGATTNYCHIMFDMPY